MPDTTIFAVDPVAITGLVVAFFAFVVAVCGAIGRMRLGFMVGGLAVAGIVGMLIFFSAMP